MTGQSEGIKLLIRVVSWGYEQTHIADIFGDDLARDIITFLSLNDDQFLLDNDDYWESVHEPMPEAIKAKLETAYTAQRANPGPA